MDATLTFTQGDQERFAQLSGDRNPAHLDSVVARRTRAGQIIVHGMHLILRALESLARDSGRPTAIRSLKARFTNPVFVGDTVSLRIVARDEREWRVALDVGAWNVASLHLVAGAPDVSSGTGDAQRSTPLEAPRDLPFSELNGRTGFAEGAERAQAFAQVYPASAGWLGGERLRALALLSTLVGMECPGRHSLFASFFVRLLSPAREESLRYVVLSADDRFRFVRMNVEGAGVAGMVEAFAPPPPVRQASSQEIRSRVSRDEFAGHVALIVGGSRGLGEVVAKVIAEGGGRPIITYATGANDAQAVAADIRAAGGHCDVLRYDARAPAERQLDALPAAPGSAYYFATGPIFSRSGRAFSPDRFRDFTSLYVDAFYDLCSALAKRCPKGISVFFPSSVAVEKRSRDMTEYAMAKAAGELLCVDMAAADRTMAVIFSRLPLLATDQTAGLLQVASQRSLDVLLPIVREVESRAIPFA